MERRCRACPPPAGAGAGDESGDDDEGSGGRWRCHGGSSSGGAEAEEEGSSTSRQEVLRRQGGGLWLLCHLLGGGVTAGAARADGIDLSEIRQLQQQGGEAGASLGGEGPSPSQEAIKPQFYLDQIDEAMPLKTIRGVWRIREFRDDEGGQLCKSRVTFRGFVDNPLRGSLEYTGCNDRKGRGKWLLKPARIDRGVIRFSARWKVNFKDGESLIYRGDVVADRYAKAEASILQGEILRPVTGVTGNLTERRCGAFEADLVEKISDEDKL